VGPTLPNIREIEEREKNLFALSVTTNTITISHNDRLPERKTPSQLATYDNCEHYNTKKQ